jgi:hypothetical protein
MTIQATPRSRRAVTAVLIGLLAPTLEVPAWCAGPPLTPQQIKDAIAEGKQYKTAETLLACLDHEYSSSPHVQWNHLCNGVLPGKRIKLKWHSQYAMFFNDFVAVAAQSAAANQQMRELRPAEVESHGLLHALVTEHGPGRKVAKRNKRQYGISQPHLVLKIADHIVQPINKNVRSTGYNFASPLDIGPSQTTFSVLEFAFDVSPQDLQSSVEVILIDGEGNRHEHEADLAGVLNIN